MTIHRHYENRQALVDATGLEFINTYSEIISNALKNYKDPYDQLRAIVVESADKGERFHFLFHAMEETVNKTRWEEYQQQKDAFAAILDQLRQQERIKAGVPNSWILNLLDGVMICSWRAYEDGTIAPRDIPELTWQTLASAIFANGQS